MSALNKHTILCGGCEPSLANLRGVFHLIQALASAPGRSCSKDIRPGPSNQLSSRFTVRAPPARMSRKKSDTMNPETLTVREAARAARHIEVEPGVRHCLDAVIVEQILHALGKPPD